MGNTKIQWTDRVWNPVTGCTKVSEGCRNCYAERMATRLAGRCGYPPKPDQFKVKLHYERLELPLHWKKPSRIFVDSMSDLFHEDVHPGFIDDIFCIMHIAHWHIFQILTKRPQRMKLIMDDHNNGTFSYPGKHVWFGVSIEDQKTANERIPWLLDTPVARRFVSCEPLLGPVTLKGSQFDLHESETSDLLDGKTRRIDWMIVGGESGPGARPCHQSWVRSLRDQCVALGIPFFFKQWGGTQKLGGAFGWDMIDGKQWHEFPKEAK